MILQISNSERSKSTSDISRTKLKEDRKEAKYRPKAKQSLTEEEKEQRRQEMMANAAWRDKEREKNVKMYREKEKREIQNNSYNKDFIRYTICLDIIRYTIDTFHAQMRTHIFVK